MTPSVIDSSGVDSVLTAEPLKSEQDFLPSEASFICLMRQLGFGLIERLQIRNGELDLNPAPAIVQHVKFGTNASTGKAAGNTSGLRQQITELFSYIRAVDAGEIRRLEVRHGLPFSMEVELAGGKNDISAGGCRG